MTATTKERPILFSGPMVQAILAGRKTQTRRVVKPQPASPCVIAEDICWIGDKPTCIWPADYTLDDGTRPDHYAACPYGKIGDRLWVRETFAVAERTQETWQGGGELERLDGRLPKSKPQGCLFHYRADDKDSDNDEEVWRPSIFMPRWASRITLEIVWVKVERVQEIDTLAALDEGFQGEHEIVVGTLKEAGKPPRTGEWCEGDPRDEFALTWDKLNGPRGFGWDVNPWVWVIEFKRIDS